MKVVISSGHGKYIRGAEGPEPWGLDEVDEARRVVNQTADIMRELGVDVVVFHDDVSDDQDENLNRIVNFHNARGPHDLDVSVHFNSATFNGSNQTNNPVGTEVFYESSAGKEYANDVVDAIADASGLINRGPKDGNLFFLSNTNEVAILIEVCFVNSKADVDIYHDRFGGICLAIAEAISGEEGVEGPPIKPPPSDALLHVVGKCSSFGGPADMGVSPSEGLAFISEVNQVPQLFLPFQPEGTTGLARRLNPFVHYIACRWDYDVTPREMLRSRVAWVRATKTGIGMRAFPSDWGPHEDTGRVADLSPSLIEDLGILTDDEVEVTFPWEE
jgi:hypothetical protein